MRIQTASPHGIPPSLLNVLLILVLVPPAKVVVLGLVILVIVKSDGSPVDDLGGGVASRGPLAGRAGLGRRGANLLEFGDEEAVYVVAVGVVAAGEAHAGVEGLAAEAGEAFLPEGEVGLDELDVGPALEGVLDDGLILLDCDGTGRVHDVAARLGVVGDGVDCGEDQLLLDVRQLHEVELRLVGLDAGVLGDDASARARGIEQDSVKAAHGLGELPSVVVGDDDVGGTEAVNVTNETLGTSLVGIVGNDDSSILHHCGHVGCFTTGSGGHIQNPLILLGVESHAG